MTKREVGNWIDRGQSVDSELNRVLAMYLMKDPDRDGAALRIHVLAITGMVEAAASAADIAG